MSTPRPTWVRGLLPVAWLILVVGLVLSHRSGAAQPTWSWLELGVAGTLEAMALYLVLRPASFDYHAGRCLPALIALLVVGTVWAVQAPRQAVPAYTVHLLWILGMTVVLCVLLGFSLWQGLQARHDR